MGFVSLVSQARSALDPETYDYPGHALGQAHAGVLWARFRTYLLRHLARLVRLRVREIGDQVRSCRTRFAEYRKRGVLHTHTVIRLDDPEARLLAGELRALFSARIDRPSSGGGSSVRCRDPGCLRDALVRQLRTAGETTCWVTSHGPGDSGCRPRSGTL
ncbi:replication initiator [Actinopolyspora sp. H202]|uniref:replication initiator n=1 Tax=Actinopolyspora sp. H202 TaxID=1500456 RepID=UPI003EE7F77E